MNDIPQENNGISNPLMRQKAVQAGLAIAPPFSSLYSMTQMAAGDSQQLWQQGGEY